MLAHLFVYEPTLTEIFFVQKVSCECWWDRRWFSGRVYGRWRRRSAVSYLWVCEHAILCESAFVQCQWSCILRARGESVKPLRNYKIGMIMLFLLANCILKVDICISPVHVIQTKRNSKFSTILFTLALVKFLKHLLSLMMI